MWKLIETHEVAQGDLWKTRELSSGSPNIDVIKIIVFLAEVSQSWRFFPGLNKKSYTSALTPALPRRKTPLKSNSKSMIKHNVLIKTFEPPYNLPKSAHC